MRRTLPQRKNNRHMDGMELLHKATNSHKWRMKVDNGMHGIFGETDPASHTIKINKKLHAQKGGGHLIKNIDGTEKLIGTIVHEMEHAKHPNMHEKTVRKFAKKRIKKMSTRQKQKAYASVNNGSTVQI